MAIVKYNPVSKRWSAEYIGEVGNPRVECDSLHELEQFMDFVENGCWALEGADTKPERSQSAA